MSKKTVKPEDEKDSELSPSDEAWHQVKKSKIDDAVNGKPDTKSNAEKTRAQKKNKKGEGDVFKFFESVGNDFTKAIQTKKNRLTQFTKKVSSVYQTKVGELIKNQQEEFAKFKTDVAANVRNEFAKFEDEFENMKDQEMKLMKLLDQQFKLVHKSAAAQEEWIEKLADLHRNILQEFEKLRNKQRTETLELTKSIEEEVAELQNNFLLDFKNEELQTMKKHFNSLYF